MGHGLSHQQRQILGLAVHANRLTQGGTLAVKTGATVPEYHCPTVDYQGVKDLQWPLAAHLLKGLPFVGRGTMIVKSDGVLTEAGNFFDLTQPRAKSAKASILRAITGLYEADHLILAPEDHPFRWGYVLTQKGLEVGERYAVPFPAALLWRAGMILFPKGIDFFHEIYICLTDGKLTLATVMTSIAEIPHHAMSEKCFDRPALCDQLNQLHLSARASSSS